MVNDHSDREWANPLLPLHVLLFLIRVRDLLYHTDRTELEWEIAKWIHHEGQIQQPIAPWADTLLWQLNEEKMTCLTTALDHLSIISNRISNLWYNLKWNSAKFFHLQWIFYMHFPSHRTAHTMTLDIPVVRNWLRREMSQSEQWIHRGGFKRQMERSGLTSKRCCHSWTLGPSSACPAGPGRSNGGEVGSSRCWK